MAAQDAEWIRSKALIGMVHVGALPATPFHQNSVSDIAAQAVCEARILADCGFDAVILENMHDRPYVHGEHGPEITASMTRIAVQVASAIDLPLGIQILSGGESEALAVALAAEAQFIRCENFVYAHVADEGVLARAAAGPLLRYRKQIGAAHIKIMCDIKKKHASHAISSDLTIADCAKGAAFFGADGVIVSGRFTGTPTDPKDIVHVRDAVELPIWVGSGVEPAQLGDLFSGADGVIVGSYIKAEGVWSNKVDPLRCRALVKEADLVRG